MKIIIQNGVLCVCVLCRDVPLVNLANILYKWGRMDDAITMAREALAVNDLEPETHYLLGNLLAANTNLSGSIYHYEEALFQNPIHTHAMDALRTIKVCFCSLVKLT